MAKSYFIIMLNKQKLTYETFIQEVTFIHTEFFPYKTWYELYRQKAEKYEYIENQMMNNIMMNDVVCVHLTHYKVQKYSVF